MCLNVMIQAQGVECLRLGSGGAGGAGGLQRIRGCNEPQQGAAALLQGSRHKLKHGRNIRKCFLTVRLTWVLAQAAQNDGEISILRDALKVSGHGSEQPGWDGLAWAAGWTRWSPEIPATSAMLWFWVVRDLESWGCKGYEQRVFEIFALGKAYE